MFCSDTHSAKPEVLVIGHDANPIASAVQKRLKGFLKDDAKRNGTVVVL